MPWLSVSSFQRDVPSIKNLTSAQKKKALSIVNSLLADGRSEKSAISIAISQAKKIKKEKLPMGELIMKATVDDNKEYIRQAIKDKFGISYCWGVTYDEEEGYAYFSYEKYDEDSGYKEGTFRVSYTLDGVNASIGDDVVRVVRESTFTPVEDQTMTEEMFTGEMMMKGIKNLFKEYFGKKDDGKEAVLPLTKIGGKLGVHKVIEKFKIRIPVVAFEVQLSGLIFD